MSLQYSTQWDGLAHCGMMFDVDGSGTEQPVYYNGSRAHEHIVGPSGDRPPCAHRLGIENMALTGVQGRDVLCDLVDAFGPGHRLIDYDDIMHVIERQRIEARKGDFLLFYTGYGGAVMAGGRQPDPAALAAADMALDGHDKRLLEWISDSEAVALIADNPAVEHVDTTLNYRTHNLLPLHQHCIFKLGMHLGELFWLSDLATYLRDVRRNAFLFTEPPLRLPGACGSPACPVATV